MGFYRVFYKNKYVHECIDNMPVVGYDIEVDNPRLYDKQYYEEYEDNLDAIRKIKNFVEGYHDAKGHIERRLWMLKNDKEFNDRSEEVYNSSVLR